MVSMDQGSDGVSAGFALEYHFGLNVSKIADFAHGAHKDVQVALRECSLSDFNLVAMISSNVVHGPDKGDYRFHQMRDAMRQAYAQLDHRTPLFAEQAAAIHSQVSSKGHDWPDEADLEKEV